MVELGKVGDQQTARAYGPDRWEVAVDVIDERRDDRSDERPSDPSDERSAGVVVFDIDGVLADVAHRLHHVTRRPKNWPAFFAAAHADPPLAEGVELARRLAREHPVVYLTGRPESLRRTTLTWLQQHGLPEGPLLMRAPGDYRPARQAKLNHLRRLERDRPVHAVIDDDPAVVAALQEAGYAVLQATWAEASAARQPALWEAQESDGRT